MVANGEEKSESPTDYKLKQARHKGQVAKSSDVNALLSMFFALFFLAYFNNFMLRKFSLFFSVLYDKNNLNLSKLLIIQRLSEAGELWVLLSLPVLGAAALGAFIANYAQVGFLLTSEPIKPDLKKINPVSGFKKIFSQERAVELCKQLIKFSVIFSVIYQAIKNSLGQIALLFRLELNKALLFISELVFIIISRILLCFLIISFFDYLWQKFSFLKSMRMSKYEVKKEYKQQEGDPHIKQERRRMHQDLQEAGAIKDLGQAAVVITNPAHLAAAIKYQDGVDEIPILIAKGAGLNAKALIQEAKRYSIPVIRNVPLARDLQWLNLNEEIPTQLYDAIAEVLIFIHKLNQVHKENQDEN